MHTPPTSDQIINDGDSDITYEEHDGKQYAVLYTDGSTVNGKSFWNASAAWSIFVAEGHKANRAYKLDHELQCNFRAELRAVEECFKICGAPIFIKSDCKGVVTIAQEIIDGRRDFGDTANEDILKVMCSLAEHAPKDHIKIKWIPSHLLDKNAGKKKQTFLDKGGTIEEILGNDGADKLANAMATCIEVDAVYHTIAEAKKTCH